MVEEEGPGGASPRRRGLFADADRPVLVAFTTALCGLLLAGLPYVGLAGSVAAVVLAVRSRRRAVEDGDDPHRLATLALLGGILGILLGGAFSGVFTLLLVAG